MELVSVRNGRMKGGECFSGGANSGGQRREFLRIEDEEIHE